MTDLFDLLKKSNCLDISVHASGSVSLTVIGEYGGESLSKPMLFSDFVYIDDFPVFMDTIADFSNGTDQRLNTHFRMEHEGKLHWVYMCCRKTEVHNRFSGMLLDVSGYIESAPNDNVISAFESREGKKISVLNNNTASLLEICGRDYLLRLQKPFVSDNRLFTALLDENDEVICSPCETDRLKYPFTAKYPVRFSFRIGAYWYIGSDDYEAVKAAEPYLKGMTDCLSSIAHSIIALYNETENSNAVNRQLGANVEQQMLINSMQSVIMEEEKAGDALMRVLEMTCNYLKIEGVAAFGFGTDDQFREFCRYEAVENSLTDVYEFAKAHYTEIRKQMSDIDHYFSNEIDTHYPELGLSAFAVSKMSDNSGVNGLIVYLIREKPHVWNYNDRKMIRSISQVVSSIIFRCESEKQIEEKNRQLYDLAFFDSMLGIKNRARLDIDISRIIKEGGSGAVMAVQIINTRFLNEVFGQRYTDKLLKEVANFISSSEIGGEGLYRYSGSIMMIVARECSADEAQDITKRILNRIREPFMIDGVEQYAEAAIGIAVYNSSTMSSEDLYRAATLSLYRANEYGKNTFAFYNREFLDAKGAAFNLESELRRSIADNMRNFEVVFQPVFDPKGVIDHYETLLRWKSESMGSVSPKVFMRMMEKVGLDTSIDLWVLPKACEFCRKIRETTGRDIKVSVNLTMHEMQTGTLPERFRAEIANHGLLGPELIAEVPERAHVLSYNDTASTLGKLKRLGMSICIDSFGNEYLPLHVLKNSYIDMIKVGSSFVTNSGGEFDDVLLSTTFSLALSRGIRTSVKNIEYSSQYEAARHAGAELMQGGYLEYPSTPDEILSKVNISLSSNVINL